MLGLPRCLGFGGSRIDATIATEVLRALEPMAIEASREAGRAHMDAEKERRRIAAQLEKSRAAAPQRVKTCQAQPDGRRASASAEPQPDFVGLAEDLSAARQAPGTTIRTRLRLAHVLITDIIADVNETTREVILVIHWKAGQRSQLRVRKPKSGEHGCNTPGDVLAVMRSMDPRHAYQQVELPIFPTT